MSNAVAFGKTSAGVSVPLAVNAQGKLLVSLPTSPTDPSYNTVTLTGAITAPAQAASVAYVDAAVAGGGAVGLTPSSIRAAASDYAAVAFDGATSGTRITSTITTNPITVNDYSIWSRFRVPGSSIATQDALWTFGSDSTGSGAYGMTARVFTSSNTLNLNIRSSAGSASGGDYCEASIPFAFATYQGQVVDIVYVRAGSVLTIYVNGTSVAVTYAGTQATFALAPGNFPTNPTQFFSVGASTTLPFRGRIYRSVVFNRALSASDVTELISTGVNPADQWGTQANVYTKATFPAAGADSWTALDANITATVNSTAPDFTTDWMLVERTTGTGRCDITRNSTLPTGQANKRFRGTALIYNEDCGTKWFGIQSDNATTIFDSSAQLANGAQGTIIQEFIAGNSAAMRIGPLASSNGLTSLGSVALNANFFVKAIVVTRIGAIVDLDFTVGTGYQTYDRSTNNLHGTMFGGVEFVMPRRSAVLYATTNTLGNQQMLGTLAIPTNAIIEDIIVNSTGVATVSIGNASLGTQIVNAAAVVSGRQKLTLATPFSTTGNLWVNSSAAVTLQFTISYTIAS